MNDDSPKLLSKDPLEDEIYREIIRGKNIILHGIGGTGKTFTTKRILKRLIKDQFNFACTAMTGIATLNLNDPENSIMCSTLHRWAGIGTGQSSVDSLLARIHRDFRMKTNWKSTQILFIDEFSMLGLSLFEKLEELGRKIRKDDRPFGGLQIVVIGDVLQLPPVKDDPAFLSEVWTDKMNFTPFYFYTPKRYDDEKYFSLLCRLREGKVKQEDIQSLTKRAEAYEKYIKQEKKGLILIKPTILYPKKVDVDSYNLEQLKELDGQEYIFEAKDGFVAFSKTAKADFYMTKLDDAIPQTIILKKGALVMCKFNIDVARGLVNGSRGIITEISEENVVVKFTNGIEEKIDSVTWEFKDKEGKSYRNQIPFILAYASTIHKSQGLTLDHAIIDSGYDIFTSGQAYVALSRVRNMDSLLLREFVPSSIMINKEALKYNNQLIKQEIKRRENE